MSLPKGWAETSLSKICSTVSQRGPDKPKASFKYIDLGAIDNKRKVIAHADTIPSDKAPSRAKQVVENGDVLFSNVRVYLENIALVPEELHNEVASTAFCVLRPESGFDSRFLYHFVTSRAFISEVNSRARGNSPPSVQDGDVRSQHIPLPPTNEQQRIASKIDELFSSIDEGERALERVRKLVQRYRQSVLKAAVTGELTRDWREQHVGELESGEALLTRILDARRKAWETAELAKITAKNQRPANDKWKQRYVEPAWPDTRDSIDLPSRWAWASLEQLCFVETGATPKRGTSRYYDRGTIDWITSSAVNTSPIIKAEEKITECAVAETNAKVFPVRTLIVAMYGEGKTRGKVAALGIPAATNQACAALLVQHLPPSLITYIRTFFEKNYQALRSEAAGGVQPNLNLSILKGTLIPVPPLRELEQVNELTAAVESHIESLCSEIEPMRKRAVVLRQAVLRRAFMGLLVPQHSADEAASVLLERIAAERASVAAGRSEAKARKSKRRFPSGMTKAKMTTREAAPGKGKVKA